MEYDQRIFVIMMKKMLLLLNAVGIVIGIAELCIYQDMQLWKALVLFLISMAYTIWPEQLLRLGASMRWKDAYDLEPTRLARATEKVMTIVMTISGYLFCVYSAIYPPAV